MMRNKYLLTVIVVMILAITAGCAGNAAMPKGYNDLGTQVLEGATYTQYSKDTTVDKAINEYVTWAEKSGWKKIGENGSISMEGYRGEVFEKGSEMLMVQAMDSSGTVLVTVITADKDNNIFATD
jgi:hypothetical protein